MALQLTYSEAAALGAIHGRADAKLLGTPEFIGGLGRAYDIGIRSRFLSNVFAARYVEVMPDYMDAYYASQRA